MKPYFDTNHFAGLLILVLSLAWGTMELAQRSQNYQATRGGSRVGSRLFAPVFGLCIIAMPALLELAPRLVPAAAIRPAAAAFAAGLVLAVAGLVLRGWSFLTLGEYFTHTVMVSPDQPVVAAGPYRVVRHPSYTGVLVAAAGIGLASANWAGAAAMLVLSLAPLLWRIRVEERALAATIGDRYLAYASGHKRLVPLVW